MRAYRNEIAGALIISLAIIGTIVFFLLHLKEKKAEGSLDLYSLILPDVDYVLSINKPIQFSKVLEHHPQLKNYFKTLIPEEYFNLLSQVKHSSILLACYPQGVVIYYHLYNEQDEVFACFPKESFVAVKNEAIHFEFYPKAPNQYLGKYIYEGVGVASSSRKLLELVAECHRKKNNTSIFFQKGLKDKIDNEAILNAIFQYDFEPGWQTVDLFLHEEQVCCLYNHTFAEITDSIVTSTADNLKLLIEDQIPDIHVQSGISIADSIVYYTFCTPLNPEVLSSK